MAQHLNTKLGSQVGNINLHHFFKFQQKPIKKLRFEMRKTQFLALFKCVFQTWLSVFLISLVFLTFRLRYFKFNRCQGCVRRFLKIRG